MNNMSPYDNVKGFDIIAPNYDLANDAMTFGLHRKWRQKLCKRIDQFLPQSGLLLDLATGTGDVVFQLMKMRPDARVVGVDPSEKMLSQAERKNHRFLTQIDWQKGDARHLSYANESFDVISMAWGIRNAEPFRLVLSEIFRMLKPYGCVCILESGIPENALMRKIYKHYSKVLPSIGEKVSGFRQAYEYYIRTVASFPYGDEFVAYMINSGFSNVSYEPLMGGIVYLYVGHKEWH